MLVSEVIERTRNEWLYPGGDNRDSFDTLAADITAGAPSMTLSGLQSFTPQSVVEFDDVSMELALTKEAESTTTVDFNERGYLESTAASHTAGTRVWIEPEFPRIVVFNALKALIQSLYGMGLYARAVDSAQTYSPTGIITLPTGAKRVLQPILADLPVNEYNELWEGQHYQVYKHFTPPKVKVRDGAISGRTLHIAYTKDFDLTGFALTTDLSTVGVPESLQPRLPMGVAGTVLQGKEPPRALIETIRNQMAAESVPVGSALQIGSALLTRFEQTYVRREVEKLTADFPPRFIRG